MRVLTKTLKIASLNIVNIFVSNNRRNYETTKTIVAFVAGLFAFTSVQAGEMTVTGSMQATYQSEVICYR